MGVLHMPTAAGHHPLKSCPRHEAPQHHNTEKRYICTDYCPTPACTSPETVDPTHTSHHTGRFAFIG